ncbi:hypothetical protein [Maricaulis sp.]|uniref:hypothetical protein n=1 Tax=Maricaulis sp. TaxID=1486257 RepID=UPI002B26E2D7|nr:hypothetical protein [Maricaulis sp.]
MRQFLAALFGLAALASTSAAQDMDQLEAALAELAGHWTGALTYRDYRTGELAEIPHERTVRLAPDGSYMITELAFVDPGYRVFGAELVTIEGDHLVVASVGYGGSEMIEARLVAFARTETGWSAELSSQGNDDNAPADILYQIEFAEGVMRQTKRVRLIGSDAFQLRNETRVRRTTAPG